MKSSALVAALSLVLVGSTVFAQDCGCAAPTPRMHSSACCNPCCDPCCNPIGRLVNGIGNGIRGGACLVQRGVHNLLNPIRFCPSSCDPCNSCSRPSCGCGTVVSGQPHYQEVYEEWSEEQTMPGPPAPPVNSPRQTQPQRSRPSNSTSEPARFQPPGAWQPSPSSTRSATRDAYFSRAGQPTRASIHTAKPATYHAR